MDMHSKEGIFTIEDRLFAINITTNCPFIDTIFYNNSTQRGFCYITKNRRHSSEDTQIIYFWRYEANGMQYIDGYIYTISPTPFMSRGIIILQMLFGPYDGFFIFNPILLLGLVSLLFHIKKKPLYRIFLIIMALNVIAISGSGLWWGGTSFGPRLLSVSIPFLFIPLVDTLTGKRKIISKNAIVIFVLISVCVGTLGVLYYKPEAIIYDGSGMVFTKDFIQGYKIITTNTLWILTQNFINDIIAERHIKNVIAFIICASVGAFVGHHLIRKRT
jgi:hypothetical protein